MSTRKRAKTKTLYVDRYKLFSTFVLIFQCMFLIVSCSKPIKSAYTQTEILNDGSNLDLSYPEINAEDGNNEKVLIRLTCGDNGNEYSTYGYKFVKFDLKSFSINEFNKLKFLKLLPIFFLGKNKELMLKSFMRGEVLNAPSRLRKRILQDPTSIPIIEDDFHILKNSDDPEDEDMKIINTRVANEIRYTTILCGGEIVTFLPVLRYIKELSKTGINLGNDPIINSGVYIFERDKAISRRKHAQVEMRYLSTLPFADEIYTGSKIENKGLLVGAPEFIQGRGIYDLEDINAQNKEDLEEGVIIGMKIRAKEDYFRQAMENVLQYTQPKSVYNSIFYFEFPEASFSSFNGSYVGDKVYDMGSISHKKSIPHKITTADAMNFSTLNRIKSSLDKYKLHRENNEYSVEGSVGVELNIDNSNIKEKNIKNIDYYNPESIIIGKTIRSNDQIPRGYYESKEIILSKSDTPLSGVDEIKNFPLYRNIPQEISKIINSNGDLFLKEIKDTISSSKFSEVFNRFPAYLSETKILPVSSQAYIFWESMKYSNMLMDEKYGIKVANFPKEKVPSLDILPKKIPRSKGEITRCCFRVVRFFQKNATPFIFMKKTGLKEKGEYQIELINPLKSRVIQTYKEYVKKLCNLILPDVFISSVHLTFEGILVERENRYFDKMNERKQELEIQENEEKLMKRIRESVASRANITPYLIENPHERYINAWRRSNGYFGAFLCPKKPQVFEKIYNIIKFGPEIIKKKNNEFSAEQIRNSVSKAVVKLVDENFSVLDCNDLFLDSHEIESFISKIFSINFGISFENLINQMPIKPEINTKNNAKSLGVGDLYTWCIEFIQPVIKYTKNVHNITGGDLIKGKEGEQLKLKNISENKADKIEQKDINLLEGGYETSCSIMSSFLTMNIVNFNLCIGKNDHNVAKIIKDVFIHQTLTDESSQIPVELGLKMFETSYFDIFERVIEQHGINYSSDDIRKLGSNFHIFQMMSKYSPTELTSETINFAEIENIFSVVFDSIVKKNNGKRFEFFNESVLARYILKIMSQQELIVPKNINTVPSFPIAHTYPWSAHFYPGLIDWCIRMVNSLVDEKLIKDKTGNVLDKNSVEPIIKETCREEIIFGIRNNIEYEADEILRRNFACHLGASLMYWYYKRPMPKWVFFDQWETIFNPDPEITISEEPEISLTTFLILKCVADLEFPLLPKIDQDISEIRKELTRGKSTDTRKGMNLQIWNSTPIRSISNKNTLSYFLFPNVINREIASKISSDDILAFSGPHEVIWVGASEKEFMSMCLNSIEKLSILTKEKKNNYFELDIWITDDENSRDLICRDVFGRFFYPKTTVDCDRAISQEGYLSNQLYSVERAKLRRAQWLAIQESIRRYKSNGENHSSQIFGQLPLSSFAVDFRESDDYGKPGSFVKNCIAAFDSALLFPIGSPYKIKAANINEELIKRICDNATELYYTSAIPMKWDEQQTYYTQIDSQDKYIISRIALAQHRSILEQIIDQNETGDHGLRNSNQFNFYYDSGTKIKVSDNTPDFIVNCKEYIWECIKNKLIFLENGFDITNSKNLVERTCRKASFRYFVSETPLNNEEIRKITKDQVGVSEWYRVRYKTIQWKTLSEVFDSIANKHPGGFLAAISQTFQLPKYMQLANFNTSKDILPIGEDCSAAISYLVKLHSCAPNFLAIFGGIVEFCKHVVEAFKKYE